jgi:hypothetical protein
MMASTSYYYYYYFYYSYYGAARCACLRLPALLPSCCTAMVSEMCDRQLILQAHIAALQRAAFAPAQRLHVANKGKWCSYCL